MTWDSFLERNKRVDRHRLSWSDFVPKHEAACQDAAGFGHAGAAEIAERLWMRATDERSLMSAFEHVKRRSGTTPGPDGCTASQLEAEGDLWAYLRGLRNYLRSGQYQHGETKPIRVRKKSGKGRRRIDIPNIEDRIVHRSIVQVFQPMLDHRFGERCFEFRPKLGRYHALAAAEELMNDGRLYVVADDIRDAFGNVPLPRLLSIVRRYAPAKVTKSPNQMRAKYSVQDFWDLVDRAVSTPGGKGLRQGAALSPLLLNLYLHHLVDRPIRKQRPDTSLLRYADDLAIFSWSETAVLDEFAVIAERLRVAGFALKSQNQPAVRNLRLGDRVTWLGFDIGWISGRMDVRLPEAAWGRLREQLMKCDQTDTSAASKTVDRWIGKLGPAFAMEYIQPTVDRVRHELLQLGFGSPEWLCQLEARLLDAYVEWRCFQRRLQLADEPV